jgi:hypothetical protein
MLRNCLYTIVTILCIALPFKQTGAQDAYLRRVFDTLASPHVSGRGYVDSGLQKAAAIIEQELRKWGVQPIDNSFRQPFKHDVVVFDGTVELKVNKKPLKPGVDFLVSPGSRAVKAEKGKLERLDSIRWIDPANRVVLELVDKLTWGVATVQDDYTVVYVLKPSMPVNIQSYSIHLDARRIKDFTSENVLGFIPGKEKRDSFLVLTAHYDHLGKLGHDAIFCGANDNASGVALMLDLARRIGSGEVSLRYSVLFIAFAGEEAGLLGSEHFVKNPVVPLNKICFLVNLDLLGTGNDGIMVVNATEYPKAWKILDDLNKANGWLNTIGQRGKARNSDHYWFTEAGVPAFFIYTLGGIAAYHDVYDVRETLPLTKTKEVGELLIAFFENLSKGGAY